MFHCRSPHRLPPGLQTVEWRVPLFAGLSLARVDTIYPWLTEAIARGSY